MIKRLAVLAKKQTSARIFQQQMAKIHTGGKAKIWRARRAGEPNVN
jgi:hypothetical protein